MPDSSFMPPRLSRQAARGRPVIKPKDMRGTLRRLWDLTHGHRQGLEWILLLSALSSASAVLSPLVIGRVITAVDRGSHAGAMLAVLLGLYIGDWLVRFLQQFFMASISQQIIHHIRITLFEAMKNLPLSFFDSHQHGELMSRLTNDVDTISTTLSNSLSELLTFSFTVLGIFVVMVSLNLVLTATALSGVLLIFLGARLVTERTRKLYARQQEILGTLNGLVEESVSGINVVKAFCREEQTVNQFEQHNEALCSVATKALIWSGCLMPLTNVINNLCFVAVSVASAALAIHGAIPIGTISSFLLYSRQFSRPFVDIANIYNNFQSAVAGAERIFEILDEPREPGDVPDALPLVSPRGTVELDHVVFGYRPDTPILKDISLDVPAGTRVAIVGPTGAGKTTIINLLTRFYDPVSGRILLDGHDLRDYQIHSLRRTFGVVLQDTALFALSVRENICYGQTHSSDAQVMAAAQVAGADTFIRRLPKGFDTVLTQGGLELSQGERQLLTIARAVLADAPILILDEATSSVDTVTEQNIRRAMLKMAAGRTSFVIAHRLSTVRDSDLIVVIDGGCIVEQGTHNDLMARNGRYAASYRTQSGEE